MASLAENLQQLMAVTGLRTADVARASGLGVRTVKGILRGESARPHATTLHALAEGLGVEVHELFEPGARRTAFDRATNPLVDQVIAEQPQLFHGWSPADFDELYSRFGAGGALTHDGTIEATGTMNRKRQHLRRAALVLESDEADLLASMIDLLYERILVVPREATPQAATNAPGASPP
ncbi:MAG: helix-turn-helix transcriptional regulator [Planctomycetes bacterium]|nr:helix-turn-helix transcriptional regulator [Planctomycetota bacterium]